MAGRPKRRAREAEAHARSAKRFDRVSREAVLKRAQEVGAAAAAREAGVAVGTLRTWRKRMKEAPDPNESEAHAPAPRTRAERLRAAAEKARAASSRAMVLAYALLARGLASEARYASVVANV